MRAMWNAEPRRELVLPGVRHAARGSRRTAARRATARWTAARWTAPCRTAARWTAPCRTAAGGAFPDHGPAAGPATARLSKPVLRARRRRLSGPGPPHALGADRQRGPRPDRGHGRLWDGVRVSQCQEPDKRRCPAEPFARRHTKPRADDVASRPILVGFNIG